MSKPLHHHLSDYFFPHERNKYRPHLFSITSVAVLVLAVIVFEAGYLVQTKIIFFRTNFLASVLPGALVALTNQDRAASDLAGVTEDLLLDKAAQAAATDMAAKGYFAHISPDGKDPWYWLDSVGYKYSYAGENLAVNFTDSQNVEMAWMNSPTHRANIEKPQYTKIGIGVANGMYEGAETTFVVQFFATPTSPEVQRTVATSVEVKPPQKRISGNHISTTSVKVLGSEVSTPAPVAGAAAPPGWFVSLLASPSTTLVTILTTLFIIIALSFITTMFMRGRTQHPNVIIGGVLLLILISVALFLNAILTGPVALI